MKPDPSPTWRWPAIEPKAALVLAGLFAAMALWQGTVAFLTVRGDGSTLPWPMPYLWEATGYAAGYLLLYVPYAALANAPSFGAHPWRFLAIHGIAFLFLCAAVPPLFLTLRHLLWWLLGWGTYDYGPLTFRLPMEWLKLAFWYVMGMGLALFYRHRQEARLRERREADLRAQLQEARLAVLGGQVAPHFMFNALHTIGSVMYEDLARTDHLLTSLAQMLRDGLESGGPAWPLARERAHLEAYLDFALARFGDRLSVTQDLQQVPPEALVPRFCLQRLVENSLKHQNELRPLTLWIRGHVEGDLLHLEVGDDGPGFSHPQKALEGPGTGLRNLKETLALQFGPRASLHLANRSEGGAWVDLRVPVTHG